MPKVTLPLGEYVLKPSTARRLGRQALINLTKATMTELEMPADQRHPDAIIEVDRRLGDEEVDELREHVKQHGFVDLPFGAKVRIPE